jgi:subtilisin family serine protease
MDQFSTALMDQFNQAALDQFTAAALDQFSSAALDQFTVASLDQFMQSILDQFDAAYFMQLLLDTLDTIYGGNARNQSSMGQILAAEAHENSTGDGVVVAVVDSGVNNHWYLKDKIVPGWDFVDNDADATDEQNGIDDNDNGYIDEGYGHGTHVAGIVSLVAPDAQIMPLRVQDSDGDGWSYMVAEAIQYATDNGADVINVSLSITCRTSVLRWATDYAKNHGVVVVASAGNQGSDHINWPARFSNTAAVAAVDENDVKASFSNYSSDVKVSAPGVDIYSAYGEGVFAWWSGTSQAAPMVSGGAALLLSADPSLTAFQVKNKLKNKADNIDAENPDYIGELGGGRLNLDQAVDAVIN